MDPEAYGKRLLKAASSAGFLVDTILSLQPTPIVALRRSVSPHARRVYVSAGIHGDERSGPLAILRFIEEGSCVEDINWYLIPLLNPVGARRGIRGNADEMDINRDYRMLRTPECAAHVTWLRCTAPRFDLCLCLHEDSDVSGFYLYEQNPLQVRSAASAILAAAARFCSIDSSRAIEGYPNYEGVIYPSLALDIRPEWTESVYLLAQHSGLVYTVETPLKEHLGKRISAHMATLTAVAEHFGD